MFCMLKIIDLLISNSHVISPIKILDSCILADKAFHSTDQVSNSNLPCIKYETECLKHSEHSEIV